MSLPVSDGRALHERFVRRKKAERRAKWLGFLFLRVPLIQPDLFLERTVRWVAPLFTRSALGLWLLGIVVSGCLIAARWDEFISPLGTILALQNVPVLWTLLIILKVFHEFGHAYACKHFGGRVPEMGAFFIVFTPCAYVDASASWGFPQRMQRVVVALGGMYFESLLAILAVVVWSFTEPGMLHYIAHYAIVLSSVVTIGFNANPLMKYDGYYILSDVLGMPNLRADAHRQIGSLVRKKILREDITVDRYSWPANLLLILFGVAGSVYKIVVVVGLSLMIAFKVPALGLAMACFYVVNTLWQSTSKLVRFIARLDDPSVRRRAIGLSFVSALAVVLGFTLLPVPGSSRALGVVQRQEEKVVRASVPGFLRRRMVEIGDRVDAGLPVCTLQNVDVASAVERKSAVVTQLRVQMQRQLQDNIQEAASTEQELRQAIAEKRELGRRRDELTVRSSESGIIQEASYLHDIGRYVRSGEPLVTIGRGPWVVNVVVTASAIADTMPKIGDEVRIRMVGMSTAELYGKIAQIAKSGSKIIDEAALTHIGGGEIPVSTEAEAQQPFFKVRVALQDSDQLGLRHGMTAWVRFDGNHTSIGVYLYRQGLNLLNQLRLAG